MKSLTNPIEQIYVVGPTASGKTSLAIRIAEQFNGEIIAADSRTIYKGLNIGTAKPSVEEQKKIKHWGFDIVGPGETYSASKFQKFAKDKIEDIISRGKLPIIVGGSGLYIDALLYDYSFLPPNLQLRANLQKRTVSDLKQLILDNHLVMPENDQNKRYLIRAIEKNGEIASAKDIKDSVLVVGLNPGKEQLVKNINLRAQQMIDMGVISEIIWAYDKYEYDSEALKGGIYKIFRDFILKNISQEAALKLFVLSDLRLAKKQMTWFKRNKNINWFSDSNSAYEYVKTRLSNN